MMRSSTKRQNPAVNAGSMADIAFLLLIFFLVTTTIVQEKGILVRLPIYENESPVLPINEEKVLTVKVNAAQAIMVEQREATLEQLPDLVVRHLNHPKYSPREMIVSLTHDRQTEYQTYLNVYDALLLGYHRVWDAAALEKYQLRYDELSTEDRRMIRRVYPLVLSEAEPTDW